MSRRSRRDTRAWVVGSQDGQYRGWPPGPAARPSTPAAYRAVAAGFDPPSRALLHSPPACKVPPRERISEGPRQALPGRPHPSGARHAPGRNPVISPRWRTLCPDGRQSAPADHPARRHHRHPVRASTSPGTSWRATPGPQAMQDVAGTIYEGATAFIRRQYTTIGILAVVGAVVIGVVIGIVETAEVADVPKLAGLPIGVMTGHRLPRRRRVLDGVGDHRHARRRQGQRPDGIGGAPQPRRGGPGRDARRGRLGLPRRRPVAPRRVGHLHRSTRPSSARSPSPRRRSSSSASASAPRSSRSSPSSAAASTPRPPTSAPTSSARSRRASPRTTPATRASSPTSSATTSATAPAVARTCSNRPPPRTSAR